MKIETKTRTENPDSTENANTMENRTHRCWFLGEEREIERQ